MSAECSYDRQSNFHPWCRVCLVSNLRMCSIENSKLIELYEKLTNTRPNIYYGSPHAICYICYSQLQRAWRFSDMAHRSQEILEDMHRRGFEPHKMDIVPNIEIAFNLSVTDTNVYNIPSESDLDSFPEPLVKGETDQTDHSETHEVISRSDNYKVSTDNSHGIYSNSVNNDISNEHYMNSEAASNDDVRVHAMCEVEIKMEVESDDDFGNSAQENIETIEIFVDPTNSVSTDDSLNKKQPLFCGICNKEFKKNCTLQTHIRTHTGEKPFECSFCEKAFIDLGSLRKHTITHTGEKPHECSYCHRMFSRKYNLQCHLKIHTKEKLYECKLCDKTFSLIKYLQTHMVTHTGEKPHECHLCHRTFARKTNLQSHMRTHTGEKPYTCNICNKTFTQKHNLKFHLRTHTGEKPYECHLCKKKFPKKPHLESHIRTHTGERPFACNMCNKAYSLKSNLQSHMKTHNVGRPAE